MYILGYLKLKSCSQFRPQFGFQIETNPTFNKLKMEMGNILKRQQRDQKADNIQSLPVFIADYRQ